MFPSISSPRPSFFHRLINFISSLFPVVSLGALPGLVSLILKRAYLRALNLHPAPIPPSPSSPSIPSHRTDTASGNDPSNYFTGASGTYFSRNMPPSAPSDHDCQPPVQLVAGKLLRRTSFKPAGMQLNVLAAAWIQAMTHDWFGHREGQQVHELTQGGDGCPMKMFRFKETEIGHDGWMINERTHWWDASFVYGQNKRMVERGRVGKEGKLWMDNIRGRLKRDEHGRNLVGDAKNGWLGVALLQEVFVREHNMVCDELMQKEGLCDDDEIFNKARLVIAAIVAKIHTVDWTVELLKNRTLEVGMRSNWWGLLRALDWGILRLFGLGTNNPPGFLGLVGQSESNNHGVPYSLTEEFVSVYRLHPMLPDGLPLPSGFQPLSNLVGLAGEDVLYTSEQAPVEVWDALVTYPCGNLELFNYPNDLRRLPPTDEYGQALPDKVDLAALDLFRDRERGLKNYNQFRRELGMKAFKSYEDLCGNEEVTKLFEEVYGEGNIEQVDLMVGMLAEKKIKGFAISETAFLIFLLMASRRLEADRFFTKDFNEETYSKTGMKWVRDTNSMRDVLKRHFPEVEHGIKEGESAFKPQKPWPTKYGAV